MTTTTPTPLGFPMRRTVAVRHLEGWRLEGACVGLSSPEVDPWFPDEELPAPERARLVGFAKSVCRGCAVRAVCLSDALVRGEAHAIAGGMTPAERIPLAAQRGFPRPSVQGASQHGQNSAYIAGCRCPACTAAHTAYVADWRARRRWSDTTRLTVVVNVLEVPTGHGRRRAWPGQLYIEGVAA